MTTTDFTDTVFCSAGLDENRTSDGTIYLRNTKNLATNNETLIDRLTFWANETPDEIFIAERIDSEQSGQSEWRKLSYQNFYQQTLKIGAQLTALGLGANRPIMMLSDKNIDQALLSFAAMLAGVPYTPVSPAYSLLSKKHDQLRAIANLINPGLIYVSDPQEYTEALAAISALCKTVCVSVNPRNAKEFCLAELVKSDGLFANRDIDADATAKYSLIAEPNGSLKAVINTHRTMINTQTMLADCYPFLQNRPPVTVDSTPWYKSSGGNFVLNMALYSGGSYYIDDGNPTPKGFHATVNNLKSVSPSFYVSPPAGFKQLVRKMQNDDTLQKCFFENLDACICIESSVDQDTFDAMQQLSAKTTDRKFHFVSSYGSAQTGEAALAGTDVHASSGNVGVPLSNVTLKLVPIDDSPGVYQVRIKSPCVTPGYLGERSLTRKLLDSEGFFRTDDQFQPVDLERLDRGFLVVGGKN